MPRAGPSRTQREREAQPSQYRSQRGRARRVDSEDDDDSEDSGPNMDPDDDMNVGATQQSRKDGVDDVGPIRSWLRALAHAHVFHQHLDKKARDLARLALFSEHKRIPLRREDINKKGVPLFHPMHPTP